MLGAVRFIWNATRGSRLRPWRSPYMKWRLETYSGQKAESITARDFWRFTWERAASAAAFSCLDR